jgi:hypothetical protein
MRQLLLRAESRWLHWDGVGARRVTARTGSTALDSYRSSDGGQVWEKLRDFPRDLRPCGNDGSAAATVTHPAHGKPRLAISLASPGI